jgi:hypothetical protein
MPMPKRISAMPAASASFTMLTGRFNDFVSLSAMGKSIQAGSMLAAVRSRPCMATPGRPTPTGVSAGTPDAFTIRRSSRPIVALTLSGVEGTGVGTRSRSDTRRPDAVSTTAALTPLPPTSTPMASGPPPSPTVPVVSSGLSVTSHLRSS